MVSIRKNLGTYRKQGQLSFYPSVHPQQDVIVFWNAGSLLQDVGCLIALNRADPQRPSSCRNPAQPHGLPHGAMRGICGTDAWESLAGS